MKKKITAEERQTFDRATYGDMRWYYSGNDILPYKDMYEYDDFMSTIRDEALFCQCAERYSGLFHKEIDLASAAFIDFNYIKYGSCPFNLRNMNDNIRRRLEDLLFGREGFIYITQYYYITLLNEKPRYTPVLEIRIMYGLTDNTPISPIIPYIGVDGLPQNEKLRGLILGYAPYLYC